MTVYDILSKKRDGKKITDEEIKYMITGICDGSIADYQASAFLMACFIQGLDEEETVSLTKAMAYSGDTIDLSAFSHTADKHSTGGVGDKTTFIAAPAAAACGCTVAKMSGRGLGHTGGTIDKMESVPGTRTSLDNSEFFANVKKHGIALAGQTGNLVPADKKLYALRDVTATVNSLPLIASSIMSKKLAAGAQTIVLDVKTGSGAFMKTFEDSKALAEMMTKIGNMAGRNTRAVISNMDEPLGRYIGNSLEVIEAVEVLKGNVKGALYDISVCLAANMVSLSFGTEYGDSVKIIEKAISSGKAYEKFAELIASQGGDISYLDNTDKLRRSPVIKVVTANRDGYIFSMDCEKVGMSACELGAGRKKKEDNIDFGAGIVLCAKVGDKVHKGDEIAYLYSSEENKAIEGEKIFGSAVRISDIAPEKKDIILDII
ncbi:MAG: thymidine phosphorylase [Ruminococcaceae bacterium]|nr:thymidine phosphorylase [Oscillospiraceae bacterium]